ncbi:MAG: hypothetical protein V3T83_22705, partial [Acidobacteriota bacterium]
AAAFLVNLLLLGLILGRGDRQVVRLVGQVRNETGWRIANLERSQQEAETLHRRQMKELRRAVGRIELRQSNAFPTPDFCAGEGRPPRKGIDKKHHVRTLARKGLDPARIAQRLNMYQGETELVLGLQQFMSSQPGRPVQPIRLATAGAPLH